MDAHKPLRLVVFLYELIRFIDMVKEMRFFLFINEIIQPDNLQLLVWFAPNMLFPLMTFFLFLSLDTYMSYFPLYIAGKCVTLALSIRHLLGAMLYQQGGNSILFTFFLTVGDLVCIITFMLIRNSLKKRGKHDEENVPGDET
ncbi:MAG: hypothetical protein LBB61_04615 [Treponema sp.]|jgi:hypothetical protein|nr:hypothetical protein [Treponema sp.]